MCKNTRSNKKKHNKNKYKLENERRIRKISLEKKKAKYDCSENFSYKCK